MDIEKIPGEGMITLKLKGKVAAGTAESFGAAVEVAIAETNQLVLDFQAVSYVASAGLRVLISAQKQLTARKGALSLCNISKDILEVFQMTGLDTILDIQ
jgi:anti-anti-sigma factor